jgi:hypothetical protein
MQQSKEDDSGKQKPTRRLASQPVVLAAIKIEPPDEAKATPKSEKE